MGAGFDDRTLFDLVYPGGVLKGRQPVSARDPYVLDSAARLGIAIEFLAVESGIDPGIGDGEVLNGGSVRRVGLDLEPVTRSATPPPR